MPEQPGQSTDVFRVMRELRAMRRLTPDPVPEALIREVVEYATYAPSGGDTEGWLSWSSPTRRRAGPSGATITMPWIATSRTSISARCRTRPRIAGGD